MICFMLQFCMDSRNMFVLNTKQPALFDAEFCWSWTSCMLWRSCSHRSFRLSDFVVCGLMIGTRHLCAVKLAQLVVVGQNRLLEHNIHPKASSQRGCPWMPSFPCSFTSRPQPLLYLVFRGRSSNSILRTWHCTRAAVSQAVVLL